MPQTWAPSAYWMSLHEGIPRCHRTRADAVAFAKAHHAIVFRQDIMTGRIDVVFLDGEAIKAGQLPIARREV